MQRKYSLLLGRGFTLIELMIVVIIVGVLASVAAPMLSNLRVKAMCAEAVMALSTVREAMREYHLEHPEVTSANFAIANAGHLPNAYPPGIKPGDLDGIYFSESCYAGYIDFETSSPPWCIQCVCGFSLNTAPKSQEINAIVDNKDDPNTAIFIDQDGNIWQRGVSRSGYKSL